MALPTPFPKERSLIEPVFRQLYGRLSSDQQEIVKQAVKKFLANPNSSDVERKTGARNLYSVKFGPKRDGRAIGWYQRGIMRWFWVGFDHSNYMRALDKLVSLGY